MTSNLIGLGPDRLRQISARLRETDCCGRREFLVEEQDWRDLGVWPFPERFESSLGLIAPALGWYAKCLYAFESLFGPFGGLPSYKRHFATKLAERLDQLAAEAEKAVTSST